MKKILLVFSIIVSAISATDAQWCSPSTLIPYNANMPGITEVILNTIDRQSSDLENYPNNSYVNTGLSSQLMKGTTYDITVKFTIDPQICPDMNIRVWIDYNQDGQLDDVGETVISANNLLPDTYTGSFTVPSTALDGNTRMRITAKMTPNGGHTMPTPCDNPPDPLGYHGEMEDYDIEILSPTGIGRIESANSFSVAMSSNNVNFIFSNREPSATSLEIYDVQGRIVKQILNGQLLNAGEYSFEWNDAKPGVYVAVLLNDSQKSVKNICVR